jgi:hypothetical protein
MPRLLALLALLPAAAGMGMPAQSSADADFWARLTGGGVAARPFVSDLSVVATAGGASTPLWAGAASGAASPPAGYEAAPGVLTAVVTAINMCTATQTPAPGVCYASPNRLGVTLARTANGALDTDLTGVLTTSSVIDVTLKLGSLSGRHNWAWANAAVSYWSIATAGGVTTLHARLSPVRTPIVDWASLPAGPQCCTCDVPSNCAVANSSAWSLGANFILQIDDAGAAPGAMAGAVFATTNAVMGALALGSGGAGSVSYALASAHADPDGAPMLGSLAALLPSAALAAVFGNGTGAAALSVARAGDPGTQSSITLANVSAAAFGTDGVMINVAGVTFSVPTYTITRASAPGSGGGGGSSSSSGAWRRGGGGSGGAVAIAVAGSVAALLLAAAAA